MKSLIQIRDDKLIETLVKQRRKDLRDIIISNLYCSKKTVIQVEDIISEEIKIQKGIR